MQRRLRGGKACALVAVIVAAGFLGGCAVQKAAKPAGGMIIEEDVGRVIKLADGSTCTEPANLGEARQLPGAQQVKALFDSDADLKEVMEQANKLKATDTAVEAAFFDVCRAYSKGEITKEVFGKDRSIYLELRQALLMQGIKAWVDKKDGIKDAGKVCMAVVAGDTANSKNTARWVPETTTVDDCALFAHKAGAGDVLLGCTEGQWKNHWAKKIVGTGPLGAKSRGQMVRDTNAVPDPNCGWL